MNDIGAAIGLEQLKRLDDENARRSAMASLYREALARVPGLELPPASDDRSSSYHLFPVLVEKREELIARMREAGIGVGVHYRRNDEYPMYERADLPGAEYFSSRVMSLPMHLDLTDADMETIAPVIRGGW